MKVLIIIILTLIYGHCDSQVLNSLTRTKTYTSKTEFLNANPELNNDKILIDNQLIKIFGSNKVLKNEILRSALPGALNSFVFSPNQEYFVAFEEAENETESLYFYRSNGTLLSKQRINIHPNVKFSSNGEYVIAFNNFGREIFVFSKTGLLIISEDYIDLIKDKTKVLENVLISEDAGQILINAGEDAYLIDSKTKRPLFERRVGIILNGNFYSKKQKIALKTVSSENYKYDLKVLSKNDGKILDDIGKLSEIDFIHSGIAILKDSSINEYGFK